MYMRIIPNQRLFGKPMPSSPGSPCNNLTFYFLQLTCHSKAKYYRIIAWKEGEPGDEVVPVVLYVILLCGYSLCYFSSTIIIHVRNTSSH